MEDASKEVCLKKEDTLLTKGFSLAGKKGVSRIKENPLYNLQGWLQDYDLGACGQMFRLKFRLRDF